MPALLGNRRAGIYIYRGSREKIKRLDLVRWPILTRSGFYNIKASGWAKGQRERIGIKPWHSQLKSADELATKLTELIAICSKKFKYAQEVQKWYHDKHTKPRCYALDKKLWLNNNYIKTKQNHKLEAKFFELFRVLYLVEKQVYKLKLSKKWNIHNIFHISLLEEDTKRKGE